MRIIDYGHWPTIMQWLLLAAGSLALGLGLESGGVPAALLLGPIIWAAILGMSGMRIRVSRLAHRFGQTIAGALIALHIDPQILLTTAEIWPVVLLSVLLTLFLACLVGLFAARLARLNRDVAIWGFMPGMASTMIALAQERGIDARMVAFIQILRLLMVIGSTVICGAFLSSPVSLRETNVAAPDITALLPTMLLIVLGMAAARWLPAIPAGASLVPILAGGLLRIYGIDFSVPHWLVVIAFYLLGAQVGLRFTPDLIMKGARSLPMLVVSVLLFLLLCGLLGSVLACIADTDLLTGILACVPGSIDAIALIAISTGADTTFVMALQTTRLFAVVLLGPSIARATIYILKKIYHNI